MMLGEPGVLGWLVVAVSAHSELLGCFLLVLRYEELNFYLNNCPINFMYMAGGVVYAN